MTTADDSQNKEGSLSARPADAADAPPPAMRGESGWKRSATSEAAGAVPASPPPVDTGVRTYVPPAASTAEPAPEAVAPTYRSGAPSTPLPR